MILPTFVAVGAGDGLGRDFRITLFYGGLWILGIVLSAAYFWWRRARFPAQPPRADRGGRRARNWVDGPPGQSVCLVNGSRPSM